MFAKRQTLLLYQQIPHHGFILKDFDFQESNVLRITHRESGYHFDAFVSHDRIGSAGIEHLLGVMYTPLFRGFVIMADRVFKKEQIEDWDGVIALFSTWLAFLQQQYGVLTPPSPTEAEQGKLAELGLLHTPVLSLASLHPAIQQAAGSRFADGYYSDAIQKACTALEKAVQTRAGQPATAAGTSLMTTAFSKNSPLIRLAADPNEQFGFMNLYQGAVQALRNHYAHNLTELTDPARALEWLGFISALFYKLDEAQPPASPPTP